MIDTQGYAAFEAGSPLRPFSFQRREPGPTDVLIEISYCGVCHTDLHQLRNEWQNGSYPMVPGHEIVGRVTRVGTHVSHFRMGDTVGVGCLVDSCRTCASCRSNLENYCDGAQVLTYNGVEKDGKTRTFGGYSTRIVVDQAFVLAIRAAERLEAVAPLLCAGITSYSPLRHWKVDRGNRIAVVGLGGIGHLAVKIASAMGAEVTVVSSTEAKRADAFRLGAHDFLARSNNDAAAARRGRFDLILDTVSASHDLHGLLDLVRRDGTLCLLGVPEQPTTLHSFPLVARRRKIAGSLIGGLAETQEMLDFCASHDITSDVEIIGVQDLDRAFDRMLRSDVRYRFALDLRSLR